MKTLFIGVAKVSLGVLGFFILITLIVFIGGKLGDAHPTTPAAEVAPPVAKVQQVLTRESAGGACLIAIERSLHDPRSAEFEHSSLSKITIRENHALVIRAVRAKNGFGAMRRAEYLCLLEKNGDTITPVLLTDGHAGGSEARKILKRWGFTN